MNIWLTKNIRFGFKYTITKSMRGQLNSCLHTWLDDLLSKRAKEDDIFIISGGLFSNTNPSLIAIDDAHKFLKKITSKLKVYLINTDRDVRLFDSETFSTLDIFSDIPNLTIIKHITDIDPITIVPYKYVNIIDRELLLEANLGKLGDTLIPNIMQLDVTESKSGVLIYNTIAKKKVFIENSFSPKHITFKIDSLEDFELIDKEKFKNDFIHIEINNNIVEEKRLEVNIALHTVNATSVKYIDVEIKKEEEILNITDSLYIVDTIFNHIGDDEMVKKQFERVLEVKKWKN